MILQIINFIFSLLWYTVLIGLGLLAAFFIYFTVYSLRVGNDFPNKRRMCTSTRKLTGQTAVVTGKDKSFLKMNHFLADSGINLSTWSRFIK